MTKKASKILLIPSLLLGLAAAGAMLFVFAEPIAAYERLAADAYSFSAADTQRSMAYRMNEASLPLIAGTVLGILGFALGLKGIGSGMLSKFPVAIGSLAVLAALYVWVFYGGAIIRAL